MGMTSHQAVSLYLHSAGVQDGTTGFVTWFESTSVSFVLAIAQEFGFSVERHVALGVDGRPTKFGLSIHPAVQAHDECQTLNTTPAHLLVPDKRKKCNTGLLIDINLLRCIVALSTENAKSMC